MRKSKAGATTDSDLLKGGAPDLSGVGNAGSTDSEFHPTEDEFAAARLFMESNPLLLSPMPETWPDEIKAAFAQGRLEVLASMRARSSHRFDLNHDLRPPENELEEAVAWGLANIQRRFGELVAAHPNAAGMKLQEIMALWRQAARDTPNEAEEKVFAASANKPLDRDMIRDVYYALKERLAIYDEFLRELAWLAAGSRSEEERVAREELIDRRVSEMNESLPVVPDNLQRIHELAQSVREERNIGWARAGHEQRASAMELVIDLLRYVTSRWQNLKAIAQRRQKEGHR